jgi:putative iron-regulated protein
VDSLLNQTKEIERAVATLALSTIKFEGSDSLDEPNKVMEENKSAGVAAPAGAQ